MPLINLDDPALFGTEEPLVGEQGLATLDAANRRREQMWSAQKQPAQPQAAQPLGILQEEAPEEMPVQEDPVTFFESPGMDFDEADPFVKDRKDLFQRGWIQAFRYGKKFRNATDYMNFVKSIPGYGPETHNLAMQMANQYMQPAVREDLDMTKAERRMEMAKNRTLKQSLEAPEGFTIDYTKDGIPFYKRITTMDPITKMERVKKTAWEQALAELSEKGPGFIIMNAGDVTAPKYHVVKKELEEALTQGKWIKETSYEDLMKKQQSAAQPAASTQPPQEKILNVKFPNGVIRAIPESALKGHPLPKGATVIQ